MNDRLQLQIKDDEVVSLEREAFKVCHCLAGKVGSWRAKEFEDQGKTTAPQQSHFINFIHHCAN